MIYTLLWESIWLPSVLSIALLGTGHLFQVPKIYPYVIPCAWIGQFLYLFGVPSIPPTEALQWVCFLFLVLPFLSSSRFGLYVLLGVLALFFRGSLSPVLLDIGYTSIFLYSLGTILFISRTAKASSTSLWEWSISVVVSVILIAQTGSIMYAKQQGAFCCALIALATYEYKTGMAVPRSTVSHWFGCVFIIPLLFAYHYSFLPWYSGVLTVLLPLISSLWISTKWRRFLFVLVSTLALLSPSLFSDHSSEKNPYEQL